LIRLDYDLV